MTSVSPLAQIAALLQRITQLVASRKTRHVYHKPGWMDGYGTSQPAHTETILEHDSSLARQIATDVQVLVSAIIEKGSHPLQVQTSKVTALYTSSEFPERITDLLESLRRNLENGNLAPSRNSHSKISDSKTTITSSVHAIRFDSLSGYDFERLVHAYLNEAEEWHELEWIGEGGNDGGRDIVGRRRIPTHDEGEIVATLCANWKKLTKKKVCDDMDKLIATLKEKPGLIRVICGSRVGPKVRDGIKEHAKKLSVVCEIMSGAELEERLRGRHPSILQRFFRGNAFPGQEMRTNHATEVLAKRFGRYGPVIQLCGQVHEFFGGYPPLDAVIASGHTMLEILSNQTLAFGSDDAILQQLRDFKNRVDCVYDDMISHADSRTSKEEMSEAFSRLKAIAEELG